MEIPKDFRITDENLKLHSHCKVCQKELLESNSSYFIEKIVQSNFFLHTSQEIFHFAICTDCINTIQSQISTSSRKAVQAFQMENLGNFDKYSFKSKKCIYTGTSIENMERYQMIAQCQGREIAEFTEPLIISGEIIELLNDLLSEETKENFDNYIGENFTGPPELAKLLQQNRVLI